MGKRKTRKVRRVVAAAMLVTSLVAGGLYYRQSTLASARAEEPVTQTTTARNGNMVITVSGAGTIVPSSEVEVAFGTTGTVTEVLVNVGDRVEAGDVLARLDASEAEEALAEAQVNLQLAELSLAELTEPAAESDVAAAEAALAVATEELAALRAGASTEELAVARANLAEAQEAYAELLAQPSDETVASAEATLHKATLALQQAQVNYAEAADDTESAADALAAYQEALLDYETAQTTYAASMEGASASELQAAAAAVTQAQSTLEELEAGATAAELASAEAAVKTAQTALDELLAGPSESELAAASLNVRQAELALTEAQDALAAVDLVAPISGTVTSVDTAVGSEADGGSVFTIADMSNVQVEFYVDETDVSLLAVGQSVSVVIDALSDQTFSGRVIRVDPSLSEVSGVPVATVLAGLDIDEGGSTTLLAGMSANVEVTAADHQDVVLLAVEAVHEGDNGEYWVDAVAADGTISRRAVEVGLTDDVNYEILSGLMAGETVVVSSSDRATTETSGDATTSQQQMGGPQGEMGFGGDFMPPMG